MTLKVNRGLGCIYTREEEKGSLYIDGVYKCKCAYLSYGYNIKGGVLVDSDLGDEVKVLKAVGKLWRYVNKLDILVSNIGKNIIDVKYVDSVNYGCINHKRMEEELDITMYISGEKRCK